MNYQDPYHLRYFLSVQKNEYLNQQVIKKVNLDFKEQNLELAIIGGSHFLHLQGSFCELFTCAPPPALDYFIYSKTQDVPFSVNHQFDGFLYTFHLFFQKYEQEAFKHFEKELTAEEHLLFHAFEKESAITSIQLLEKQSHRLRLVTWHTYPENQVVVRTLTTLKI
jgi:hypothetical protein